MRTDTLKQKKTIPARRASQLQRKKKKKKIPLLLIIINCIWGFYTNRGVLISSNFKNNNKKDVYMHKEKAKAYRTVNIHT